MAKLQQKEVLCQVCKEQKRMSEVLTAELVRGPIVEKIKRFSILPAQSFRRTCGQ